MKQIDISYKMLKLNQSMKRQIFKMANNNIGLHEVIERVKELDKKFKMPVWKDLKQPT